MLKKRIYLDYAASTPVDNKVLKLTQLAQSQFANPSAQYASARQAKATLEQARKDSAMFLQCNSEEITFTSGATESNNLAILGIARARGEGRVISIASEHPSVMAPLAQLTNEGFEVVFCPIDNQGKIRLDAFQELLSKNTTLVSLAYANGELGTIQPLSKISQIIQQYNKDVGADIKLHTDASAGALTLPCDVARLGVDALTIGGSKIYGPHGVGLLYLQRGTEIDPLLFGGGQQKSIRPGTESVGLAVGLATALSIVAKRRKVDHGRFLDLHSLFKNELTSRNIQYTYNGHQKERLFQLFNIIIKEQSGEDLVAKLDARGIEVATGAACEASKDKPSRALLAIGLSKDQAQSSLRISFGRSTTEDDITTLAQAIFDII